MASFLTRRLSEALLVCFTASIVAFALVHVGDNLSTAIGGMEATPQELARIRAYYGFDRSLVAQYLGWAGHVLSGDLGTSFFSHENVTAMILDRAPVTVALAISSLLLALLIGVPLGLAASVRRGAWPDRLCLAIATLAQAMPSYWTGLLLILLFGVRLQLLPISGTESWQSFVLPSVALAWFVMPVLARLTRAGMLEVLGADYIRTARAKGLPPRMIFVKHALRNAILPVVSVAMVQLGYLLGGSIVVESVFALNGVGLLAWNAIQRSDFPVVQGIVIMVAALFVLLNLCADLINGALDPRLRR
ncbi:peptide/nickel transport system permease protein [Rhizobiales bacterium GAS191]|nr:peptide/nickel transport system permease protein [Rhizobiales bacterium GAS113]SED61881.1 peptide/nickel transport system permease protein [Rhizobiales bacterium GAS188]SEE87249.1 peptide/nickel transport system permease protein [Rhizobiales bacterium GAS191]